MNVNSQFIRVPTNIHLEDVERILYYHNKDLRIGLLYTKQVDLYIKGYADADWVDCVDNRKSTTRYCVYLGGNVIL